MKRFSVGFALIVLAAGCSGDDPGQSATTDPDPVTTEPTVATREPGPGSDWIDEPLPRLEDLLNASNCDDFMRMLVGVENERFNLKVDVTATDDLANNYTHWDFDEYDVFAEL